MNNPKPTLKQIRIRKGWTPEQTAFMAKVSVSTIFRIERGEAVSELMISRVCNALGVNMENVSVNKKEKKKDHETRPQNQQPPYQERGDS